MRSRRSDTVCGRLNSNREIGWRRRFLRCFHPIQDCSLDHREVKSPQFRLCDSDHNPIRLIEGGPEASAVGMASLVQLETRRSDPHHAEDLPLPRWRGTAPWPGNDLSRAFFPKGATPAAKVFLGPLTKGTAAIVAKNGASLSLAWPAALFPFAGIWITRGFWKGLHHWAIEPTNAPVDRLSDIRQHSPVSQLDPREVREWTVTVRLTPKDQP